MRTYRIKKSWPGMTSLLEMWKSAVSDAWCKKGKTLSSQAGLMQQSRQLPTQENDYILAFSIFLFSSLYFCISKKNWSTQTMLMQLLYSIFCSLLFCEGDFIYTQAGLMRQRRQTLTQEGDWKLWLWAVIAFGRRNHRNLENSCSI